MVSYNEADYVSLTDIARFKSDDPTAVIGNWMCNRNTVEYRIALSMPMKPMY